MNIPKNLMCFFVLCVCICLSAASVLALDRSLYGIELGKPLTIKECDRNNFINNKEFCVATWGATEKAWGSKDVDLYFPSDVKQRYINGSISVSIVGDNVESIVIPTNGYSYQDDVIEILKRKYGTPKKIFKIPLKNAFNSRYTKLKALWVSPDMTVVFEGIEGGNIDFGRIEVSSKKYNKIITDWKLSRQEKEPKM